MSEIEIRGKNFVNVFPPRSSRCPMAMELTAKHNLFPDQNEGNVDVRFLSLLRLHKQNCGTSEEVLVFKNEILKGTECQRDKFNVSEMVDFYNSMKTFIRDSKKEQLENLVLKMLSSNFNLFARLLQGVQHEEIVEMFLENFEIFFHQFRVQSKKNKNLFQEGNAQTMQSPVSEDEPLVNNSTMIQPKNLEITVSLIDEEEPNLKSDSLVKSERARNTDSIQKESLRVCPKKTREITKNTLKESEFVAKVSSSSHAQSDTAVQPVKTVQGTETTELETKDNPNLQTSTSYKETIHTNQNLETTNLGAETTKIETISKVSKESTLVMEFEVKSDDSGERLKISESDNELSEIPLQPSAATSLREDSHGLNRTLLNAQNKEGLAEDVTESTSMMKLKSKNRAGLMKMEVPKTENPFCEVVEGANKRTSHNNNAMIEVSETCLLNKIKSNDTCTGNNGGKNKVLSTLTHSFLKQPPMICKAVQVDRRKAEEDSDNDLQIKGELFKTRKRHTQEMERVQQKHSENVKKLFLKSLVDHFKLTKHIEEVKQEIQILMAENDEQSEKIWLLFKQTQEQVRKLQKGEAREQKLEATLHQLSSRVVSRTYAILQELLILDTQNLPETKEALDKLFNIMVILYEKLDILTGCQQLAEAQEL